MNEPPPRWWELRRAQNRKPATYRCPICDKRLASMSEHALIAPEGDFSKRRHAHTKCVMVARREGRLPTREEWRRAERGDRPSVWARLRAQFSRPGD